MQQWEMNEMFTFPKQLGNIQQNSKIVVEPKWHEEINEDSVVLRGIYVVKGNIQFDHKAREEEIEEGIYIEHIDIEKDYGYFEYALPFSVDFPNDQIEKVSLQINEIKIEPNSGYCLCSWKVNCDVERKVQAMGEVEKIDEVKEVKAEKEVEAIQEIKETVEPIQHMSTTDQEAEEVQSHILFHEEVQRQAQQLPAEEIDFLEQLADAYSRVQIQLKK
ncbi:alanine racemase [Solibacillus ferritrahens]|uniref:alanine racemase n=1 Tax=Solibacillus ferritrahens TaxID=3098620 RepID=UPI00300BA296